MLDLQQIQLFYDLHCLGVENCALRIKAVHEGDGVGSIPQQSPVS